MSGPRRRFDLAAALILLAMGLLAGTAAWRESPVFDEPAHVGAGLSYWQRFDYRFNNEHPPLSKLLAGLPLALSGTRADYDGAAWRVSDRILPAFLGQWSFGEWVLYHWNEPMRTIRMARAPMLLLTLGLGWLLYLLGSRLGGAWGGLLCVALYASTPLFLTFGPLVLSDVPLAFFAVVTLWRLASLLQDPVRRNVWWFGLALGGALLTKFSAGMLLFVIAAVTFRSGRWRPVLRGIAIAAGLVYAVYFVLSWNQPIGLPARYASLPAAGVVTRLLMPVWLYLVGVVMVLMSAVRPTYILGQSFSHGVWYYFPVLFALKSQLGFLAIVAVGAVFGWKRRGAVPAEYRRHWRVLVIGFGVLTGLSVLSHLNIGLRHLAVPLALLILLLAPVPRLARGWERPVVASLAAAAFAGALMAWPNYIPWVNALSLGRPAWMLVSDSNLDWNHALPEARDFLSARAATAPLVDSYSISFPDRMIPGSRLWDCQAPSAQDQGRWAVVSANMLLPAKECRWLLNYEHAVIAGGSMYAVHLPENIPPAGQPGGPPPPHRHRVLFDAGFEIRTTFAETVRDPQTIPAVAEQMEKRFNAGPPPPKRD